MLSLFTAVLATNIRKLGLESQPGYLFGVVDGHVSFISKSDLAHEFIYSRITEEGHFTVEVQSMPNVFFSILSDDTLGYKFIGATKPVSADSSCLFKIRRSKDFRNISIMHEGMCLSYNKLRFKFEKRECEDFDPDQLFVPLCHENGVLIDDYLPPMIKDTGPKLLFK